MARRAQSRQGSRRGLCSPTGGVPRGTQSGQAPVGGAAWGDRASLICCRPCSPRGAAGPRLRTADAACSSLPADSMLTWVSHSCSRTTRAVTKATRVSPLQAFWLAAKAPHEKILMRASAHKFAGAATTRARTHRKGAGRPCVCRGQGASGRAPLQCRCRQQRALDCGCVACSCAARSPSGPFPRARRRRPRAPVQAMGCLVEEGIIIVNGEELAVRRLGARGARAGASAAWLRCRGTQAGGGYLFPPRCPLPA